MFGLEFVGVGVKEVGLLVYGIYGVVDEIIFGYVDGVVFVGFVVVWEYSFVDGKVVV